MTSGVDLWGAAWRTAAARILRAAAGERNKEIALNLDISPRTVKAHLTSIYNKLGVDSRTAAIAIAAKEGWNGQSDGELFQKRNE